MKTTIGNNRLGAGKKMTVDLKTYERSTHDLSYIWRSTMASGTLVPFLSEVGLPGDTFDITLDCDILTHPTIGPLFGSYKVQLDIFQAPIRLYNGLLHNNALGIGMNMSGVILPQLRIRSQVPSGDWQEKIDNIQINPSCIFSYLNIRGIGLPSEPDNEFYRDFNGIPFLAYWDIYKNYYANKQEEIGAVIHNVVPLSEQSITTVTTLDPVGALLLDAPGTDVVMTNLTTINFNYAGSPPTLDQIMLVYDDGFGEVRIKAKDLFNVLNDGGLGVIYANEPKATHTLKYFSYATASEATNTTEPQVYTFDLKNIDEMRSNLLKIDALNEEYIIDTNSTEPYGLPFKSDQTEDIYTYSQQTALEGLALKTYQSDLFNNWMQTEWIDGPNGISAVTAIDTSSGNFTIDTLNLSKKVYDMLNRIAISGGTYEDWQRTVYTHESFSHAETPMYMGGLSKELVFQEVISNSQATTDGNTQPLGTLAGRGKMSSKHKGGYISIKVSEPSYIMGIISLTPRIDYSQGNKWDTNLKNMDEFHKPALDEIGFQDLITDQMAWWDTKINAANVPTFSSAGKQPAWIQYMTNVNQVRGNFAIEDNEMFMTLNRKYQYDAATEQIQDLTTYIDPKKFNDIFAQTSRDAQNFWTQIGVDIEARRKMSAKIMPNL